MLRAFDTLLQMEVSANAAAANSDNEAFTVTIYYTPDGGEKQQVCYKTADECR